jgi:four helix bundle protein
MLKLSHKKLTVWEYSTELVSEIYRLTNGYPDQEKFGLTSQMRRAAISVVSNISEGSARRSKREKIRFYEIARSSLVELDAQIEISIKLSYVEKSNLGEISNRLNSTFSLLSGLIKSCTQLSYISPLTSRQSIQHPNRGI